MTATKPNDSTQQNSPLARALAAQSAAQFDDLKRARGVDASTFSALADRAEELHDTLGSWGFTDQTREAVAAHRAALTSVSRLLADPTSQTIPPSNDRIYAAVLDITELAPIVGAIGTAPAGRDAISRHLNEPDPATARADRLALSFAAVCKRGGIAVSLPDSPGMPIGLEVDGWRVSAAPAVPLQSDGLASALDAANASLRAQKRPGLIILEAGPLLDWQPITVAEDAVAINLMNERLEAFMLDTRGAVLETIGSDHAFGLIVHATLPATNAVSNRLLFAECLRAVNLCDSDDPRADGFRSIVGAFAHSG